MVFSAVDKVIEKPNTIKIDKAKLGEKKITAEESLTRVMKTLLPSFDSSEDLEMGVPLR